MKKLLLLLTFISTSMFAQTIDSLFVQANNLYNNAKYTEAINVYKSIEAENMISDALYYNLGNCYYKLNKVAPAIYNYEKALLINPKNSEAKSNLVFANRMKIDDIKVLPKTFIQKLAKNTYQKLSYKTWSILAVLASFLTAIMFLLYYFSYHSTKKLVYFNTAIFAFVFLLSSTFFAFKTFQIKNKTQTAIVFSQVTALKTAPINSAEIIYELHEGTKVNVIEKVAHWSKVKLVDGRIGWIPQEAIKEL